MVEKNEKPVEGTVDFRALYGRDYIGSWDLVERDRTLKIARVVQAVLRSTEEGKKPDKRPVIYFEGTDKGFVLNVTNGTTIAGLYGNKVAGWIGKRITLYASTCMSFGKRVDCIRVRPAVPNQKMRTSEPIPNTPAPTVPVNAPASEAAPDEDDGGWGRLSGDPE